MRHHRHHVRVWKARYPGRGWEWMLVCDCGMIYGSPTWVATLGRGIRHLEAMA